MGMAFCVRLGRSGFGVAGYGGAMQCRCGMSWYAVAEQGRAR